MHISNTRSNSTLLPLAIVATLGVSACSDLERTNPVAQIGQWESAQRQSSQGGSDLSSGANASSSGAQLSSAFEAPNYDLVTDYSNNQLTYGTLNDARDGQSYPTIAIAGKTWMARNLNYSGDNGSSARTFVLGWCYGLTPTDTSVHADAQNCVNYGRSYQWAEAMGFEPTALTVAQDAAIGAPHRGICPENWHVPTDVEWSQLQQALSVPGTAAELKSAAAWVTNASNLSGLSAVPAGQRITSGWAKAEQEAFFWSATETYATSANLIQLTAESNAIALGEAPKYWGASLRCVHD
jgi:uncharacterized protein (TIGR02145 family)